MEADYVTGILTSAEPVAGLMLVLTGRPLVDCSGLIFPASKLAACGSDGSPADIDRSKSSYACLYL